MKYLPITTALIIIAMPAMASEHVRGYQRQDGTYVSPHYRSSPDSTTSNNYSTQGNTNPYTGEKGTVRPDRQSDSMNSGYGNNPNSSTFKSGPSRW